MINVPTLIATLFLSLLPPPPVHTAADNPEKPSDKAAVAASVSTIDVRASQRPLGDTQMIAALESVLADLKASSTANPRQVKAIQQLLDEVRDRQFLAAHQHGQPR